MADLFETLGRASALLSSALDQYIDACSAIRNYPQLSFAGVSRAFFDRAASELPLATSYETKIKQAKSTTGQAINLSFSTPHINSLPPEILIRIFFMTADACDLDYHVGENVPLPRYPEYLSHVCTRWRQIALDSSHLWTHVDLVSFSPLNQGFKTRAETFRSRAGSCLLDIHLYELKFVHVYDHQSMLNILAVAAPQTRSLEIVAPQIPAFESRILHGIGQGLVDYCFSHCVPGTLTELKLEELYDRDATQPRFIDSHERTNNSLQSPYQLDVTAECLDALLLPITQLHLNGVYFPWTHRAYHGLVELRLATTGEREASITKQELLSILTASPRLKIFYFMLKLSAQHHKDSQITPARMDDLEVLHLHSLIDQDPQAVLSLLTPGPKPLRLSCGHNHDAIETMEGLQQLWLSQTIEFSQRSNITKLRLRLISWSPHAGPENLLGLLSIPNLRVLALDTCYDEEGDDLIAFPLSHSELPHLDVMYMTECSIRLEKLERTLKRLQVNHVVFWDCSFIDGVTAHREDEVIKAELGTICPSFRWVNSDEPNPIEHWD